MLGWFYMCTGSNFSAIAVEIMQAEGADDVVLLRVRLHWRGHCQADAHGGEEIRKDRQRLGEPR